MQLEAMGQKSDTTMWRLFGLWDTANHDHKCNNWKGKYINIIAKDNNAFAEVIAKFFFSWDTSDINHSFQREKDAKDVKYIINTLNCENKCFPPSLVY